MSPSSSSPSPSTPSSSSSPPPLPPFEFDRKDFLAGTFAGFAICVSGHPLDLIKVRLQTQDILPTTTGSSSRHTARFRGGLDVLAATLKYEGLAGLYKGMSSPLFTVPLLNAIVFASYEQARRTILYYSNTNPQTTTTMKTLDDLTLAQIGLAGAWAGFTNSFICSPVELIKARLQVQYEAKSTQSLYRGPLSVIRTLIQASGPSSIFTGLVSTIYREIPAYFAQFYFFEGTKTLFRQLHQQRQLAQAQTQTHSTTNKITDNTTTLNTPPQPLPLSFFELFIAGGIGGIGCWVFSYPQDVIKSRLQVTQNVIVPLSSSSTTTTPSSSETRYVLKSMYRKSIDGGFWDCLKRTISEEGLSALWKGFGPCAARAFIANGVGLAAYEVAARFL